MGTTATELLPETGTAPTPQPTEAETARVLDRWRSDICAFADDLIQVNELGEPFKLQPYQREVLRLMLQRRPDGRFKYQTLVWSEPKKSGKTFIEGLFFDWWAMTQEPPNEIILVANDQEQAEGRAFNVCCEIFRRNPRLSSAVKITKGEIFIPGNGTRIRAIPCDYAGEAGSNHGLTGWDELWAYRHEGSRRLWDELTPVPTRKNSTRLVVTYAGFEGESLLLHELYLKGVGTEEHPNGQGKMIHPTLPVYANEKARLVVFWSHEVRQVWQTEGYMQEQRELNRPSMYLRLFENRWVTGESIFLTPALWDPCVEGDLGPELLCRERVYVGVDAAHKHDNAAVVVLRWDGMKLRLVQHRIWRPSPDDPLDIEDTIEAYLLGIIGRFNVGAIYCDPAMLQRTISAFQKRGYPIQEYVQSPGNLARMGQALFESLKGRTLRLYPDEDMRAQALATVAEESTRGWKIAKEKASRKIDVIVAMAMATVAALEDRGILTEVGKTQSVSMGVAIGRVQEKHGWLGAAAVLSAPRPAKRRPKAEELDPRLA